ncbi:MAG: hypothetical protein ACP5NC_06725 [Nitrososphaeria archaeon]
MRVTILKVLKVYYRWFRTGSINRNAPYPPEIAWIKTTLSQREIQESEVLTKDEIIALIDSTSAPRDKVIIAVLAEGDSGSGRYCPQGLGI